MSDDARGGNDELRAGPSEIFLATSFLVGDATFLSDDAKGGDDELLGSRGDQDLVGDGTTLSGRAAGGDDELRGSRGDDRLAGDAFSMFDEATGGDDRLHGGRGDDTLYGDTVELLGGAQGGDDRIDGGDGDDLLFGDARPSGPGASSARGVDTFVFRPDDGQDTLGDFEVGKDRIKLVGFGPAASLASGDGSKAEASTADLVIREEEGDTVVDLGSGGITLLGVTDLDASDLLIA
jgi:Ca2+-binding RTX toxin-like protein